MGLRHVSQALRHSFRVFPPSIYTAVTPQKHGFWGQIAFLGSLSARIDDF
jgi:hypothetical protein